MKKALKLASLLLAIVMLAACFSGCSSKEESEPAASEDVVTESAAQENVAEAEDTPEAPAELTYPLCEETVELSVYVTELNLQGNIANAGIDSWDEFIFFDAVEELTNVHIKLNAVTFAAFTEQFNLYIAGGEYDDIIVGLGNQYVGGLPVAYDSEVIMDLTDLVPEYAPNYYNMLCSDELVDKQCRSDGGLILDFKSTYDDYICKNGTLIRGDLLEKLGMDVPQTVAQLEEVLMAFKSEFDMENPVYMDSNCSVPAGSFGVDSYQCGGSDLGYYVVDDVIYTTLSSEGYYKALETVTRWYSNGLINEDFATVIFDPRDPDLNSKIINGGVAYWDTQLEGIDDYNNTSTIEGYNAVPMPTLVENEGDVYHFSGTVKVDTTANDVCISTQCEYPEIAVQWIDYWYSDAGVMMYNYGVEGDTYEMVDGEIVLDDKVINNEYGVDISSCLRLYCPYGSFFGVYMAGRMDFMASDLYMDAKEVWAQNSDTEYIVPTGVVLTTEESEELSFITAEISTYVSERIPRIIMGEISMDEWDSILAQCEELGLSRATEINQAAYDRYIGK